MMKIEESLQAVERHLKKLRIKSKLVKGVRAKPGAIQQVEKRAMPLPEHLKKIYSEVGDGLVFYWKSRSDFGMLLIPTLKELARNFEGWKELVLWMDEYAFPAVKN